MPGRYFRAGLLDSKKVDNLFMAAGAECEMFFVRLMLIVDDYGRYENDPVLIRNMAFPRRDNIRIADVTKWLSECEKAGLVVFYGNGVTQYLQIVNFGQQARKKSKYPDPPENIFSENAKTFLESDKTFLANAKTFSENDNVFSESFCLNGNGNGNNNGNDNGREIPPAPACACETSYPETVEQVLEIAARPDCGAIISRETAEHYLLCRMATDWVDAANRKIKPERVRFDLKKWALEEKNKKRNPYDALRPEDLM